MEGAQRVAPNVIFFKVLGQPGAEDGGGEFEVVVRVGVRVCRTCGVGTSGADDGAVLGHVDAAVDVSMAVEGGGQAVALGLWHAVLAGGAGLVFPVHHQLDPTFSTAQLEKNHR